MRSGKLVRAALLCLLGAAPVAAQDPAEMEKDVTQGALRVKTRAGRLVECPLRHTEVQADVSGFVARVKVTQQFANPWDEPIEAVYVFPLPHNAAVDDMTMVVGKRRIVGMVKRRAEAREIYERALDAGLTASLLEQERPNIFTQSVGNIPPGQDVQIEISYVDTLAYDQGTYEFHFPMVVGPRYIPGTDRVPDADRISPPVLQPGYRNGHDIGLSVRLEAGVPIRDLRVTSHEAALQREGASRARIQLSPAGTIPNKDFVLRYAVAGAKPEVALLTHAPRGEDGYFLLMIQPRQMQDELRAAPPREICFLVDVSGSMSGQPTAKVVQTMRLLLQRMRAQDRIQVVTFAGQAQRLFPSYLPATPDHVARALAFTDSLEGSGGTDMLSGMRAVMADPVAENRVRIVLLLTDGYIGNEDEIIREVGRRAGDRMRFWAVGIGSSPNRHLIDGVGKQGGMSANLGLDDDPAPLVARVADRMQRAQLGQIELDWGPHAVYETYPARIPDLWSGSPVVVLGRYRGQGAGTLRVNGTAEGQAVSFPIEVQFPEAAADHAVLAKVWARRKIEDLSEQMVVAGDPLEEEITELALHYRLASAYTSFVAVDESEQARLLASPQRPRRVAVPVPLPEGVRHEGIFGKAGEEEGADEEILATKAVRVGGSLAARVPGGVVGGVVGGVPGGVEGGTPGGARLARMSRRMQSPATPHAFAFHAPPPPPPAPAVQATIAPMYEAPALMADAAGAPDTTRHEAAKKDLARAVELAARQDWLGARRALQRAWLLEEGFFAGSPWADDGTRSAISAQWQALEAGQATAMSALLPALAKPLSLVVRNQELEAALDAVAREGGFKLRLVPGSLADAAQLQKRSALRVAYLDLRRATAAQALGWLLGPFGLEWSVEDGTVVVRSARRGPGASVWVYPHAAQGLPETRGAIALGSERLLVEGDALAHERVAKALSAVRPPGAEGMAAEDLARAGAALRTFSWALLAGALAGEVDDEAVSELREAWRVAGLADLLAKHDEPITLAARTAWAVELARKAKRSDPALNALAEEVHAVLASALPRRPRSSPFGPPAAQLYFAMRQRDGGATDAERVIAQAGDLAPVATSLLKAPAPDAIQAAFEQGRLRGDDAVVLAAWALRASGPAGWTRFRVARADWLNNARTSGAARRVVSRLDAARLPAGRPGPVVESPAPPSPRRPMALAAACVGAGLGVTGLLALRRGRRAS